MPFSIRPHRRFPVQGSVMYNAGPFQGQGTIWNRMNGWRLSGGFAHATRGNPLAHGHAPQ